MIKQDTKLLNELMGYSHDEDDDFPYKDFIQKFPYPTNMEIDVRMNPVNVDKVFMTYPYCKDQSIIDIKEIVKDKLDHKDKNTNPFMNDLHGFNFGECTDSPKIVKIIPQDNRIDLCIDKTLDWINIAWFQQKNLIKDFDGLHFFKDREIMKDNICRFDLMNKTLSDSDLMMIKH